MTNFGGNDTQWGGQPYAVSVADAPAETRASFIRKTYLHLLGAVLAFIGLEVVFMFALPDQTQMAITNLMMGTWWSWLLVLAMFMGVSYGAEKIARSDNAPPMQYAGLALLVLAWSVLFLPILFIARVYAPAGTIGTAAFVTGVMFVALTAYVLITKQDFSWLGGILAVIGVAALMLIVGGAVFGLDMGLWFIVPMIAFAAGYILYHTSNLLHVYTPGQHVAASMALFASVALLFWYVLQLIMSLQRD